MRIFKKQNDIWFVVVVLNSTEEKLRNFDQTSNNFNTNSMFLQAFSIEIGFIRNFEIFFSKELCI